ncbi:MAG: ERF family protein [Turicibacter sp.]|nr:ERF family protein [Turicibacter sp.]
MSVYKKLQRARAEFVEKPIKKTGLNKHQGYQYFELGDFIPVMMHLLEKHGLCSVTSYDYRDDNSPEYMTLKIIDSDKPEDFISFIHPVYMSVTAKNPIQNSGATTTYCRRYLWLMAFEIVECDQVDGADQNPKKSSQSAPPIKEATPATGANRGKEIEELIRKKDVDEKAVVQWISSTFKTLNLDDLTSAQVIQVIEVLSKKPSK